MTTRPKKRETATDRRIRRSAADQPARQCDKWFGTHSTMKQRAASEEASLATCPDCGYSGGRHGGMCSLG